MRSRNIKPGFFKNDELAELDPLGRLLFIGLWCMADREGRLEYRPKKIKAEVLPYDNCNITKLLKDLIEKKFIIQYSVNSCNYIQISKFSKHQTPHIKEQASIIPAPDLHQSCTSLESLIPDSLIPDSLIPDSIVKDLSTEKPVDCSNGFKISNLAEVWNEKAPPELARVNLPFKRNPRKLKILNSMLNLYPEKSWWEGLISRIHDSSFLRGSNDRGWKANFDFVVTKADEISDGKYFDGKTGTTYDPNLEAARKWAYGDKNGTTDPI